MFAKNLTLTREDLYRQIWSEPIVHVAKRLALSDRGLAKLCARHSIPVPPRGWWAKKQHGHPVRQVPLLPNNNPHAETIVLHAPESEPPVTFSETPECSRENSAEWRIEVPEDLEISHPLVRGVAVAIRRAARERRDFRPVHWNHRFQARLCRPGPGHLEIAVSKPLVPRALRIMQALVTALERRGYPVSVTGRNETIVRVLDKPMQIALIERFKQVVVKRTYGDRVDLEPSGRLRLRVGASYSNSGVEDRPPRLIEGSLNHFISGLVRRALEAKRERAIHEERERRWRIHDDECRRREQERDSERLRVRRLRTLAARWSRHQRLGSFVAAAQQRVGELEGEQQEAAMRWLEWATQHLSQVNPVDAAVRDPWPTAPLRAPAPMPWNWK
jgi:hypothetical protein